MTTRSFVNFCEDQNWAAVKLDCLALSFIPTFTLANVLLPSNHDDSKHRLIKMELGAIFYYFLLIHYIYSLFFLTKITFKYNFAKWQKSNNETALSVKFLYTYVLNILKFKTVLSPAVSHALSLLKEPKSHICHPVSLSNLYNLCHIAVAQPALRFGLWRMQFLNLDTPLFYLNLWLKKAVTNDLKRFKTE